MTPIQKQAKIDEAIRRGFITKHIDADGLVRYVLTKAGMQRWMFERIFQKTRKAG